MRKTKKFAAILLSALILSSSFSILPVSAATFGNDTAVVSSDESLISGDYEYSVLADGTVEITQYLGSDSDVTIPNTIDDKKVTSIGSETFSGCISLTSVIMPDSILNQIFKHKLHKFFVCKNFLVICSYDNIFT